MVAATGCRRAHPVVAAAPAPFPAQFTFVARSAADSAIEGTFEGTAAYDKGWLTVSVPRAVVTVPPGKPENWRNLTVRSFVATDYPGAWRAVAQSRPVNVFRFIDFGSKPWSERRTFALETPLAFQVPVPPGAVAARTRLAFELEWVVVLGTFGDTDSRIVFTAPIPVPPTGP